MCDYCDCRVVPLIAELGEEHATITVAATAVREAVAAGDLRAARSRLAALTARLAPHTTVEEHALFPALSGPAGSPAVVDELLGDHEAIDGTLRAAADADDADLPALVDVVLTRLAAHIHREEYDAFPAAAQLVDPGEWDAVGVRAAEARAAATGGAPPRPLAAR